MNRSWRFSSSRSGNFRAAGKRTWEDGWTILAITELALTPRLGLIYEPSKTSAVKLLYGQSFREPSGFEEFYNDGLTQISNPELQRGVHADLRGGL